MDLYVLLVWFQFKMMFFPQRLHSGFFKDGYNKYITHDIFYYFPFPHCVILSYLQHISSLNLHIWKVTIKGRIQIKQAVQRGTFLDMPAAIDQETSVTHSLVTLPKKTIKAVCARCRKDFILAIFLSMDFYFVSLDRRCSLNGP